MDLTNLSLLNGILDQIQAMGIIDGWSSVYDQIGLKYDNRETYISSITHLVATVEDLAEGSPLLPPEPRTDWVQISDHQAPSYSSKYDLHSEESPKPKSDSAHDPESM